MSTQRNHLNHQKPDFTKQDLDSKFSEVLASLLADGYTFIYTVAEYSSDKYPITPYMTRQVMLEKGGEQFVLGEVKESKTANSNTDFKFGIYYTKKSLALVKYQGNIKFYLSDSDIEDLLIGAKKVFYCYYTVSIKTQSGDTALYYKEETPAKTIVEKKIQRRINNEWKDKGILMTINLKETPYKNFRKNVVVNITQNRQYIYNQNGKLAVVNKWNKGLESYDLKRA